MQGRVVCEGDSALLGAHREGGRVEEIVVVEERVHRRGISGDGGGVGAVHEPGKRLFGLHLVVVVAQARLLIPLTSLLSPVWHTLSPSSRC